MRVGFNVFSSLAKSQEVQSSLVGEILDFVCTGFHDGGVDNDPIIMVNVFCKRGQPEGWESYFI